MCGVLRGKCKCLLDALCHTIYLYIHIYIPEIPLLLLPLRLSTDHSSGHFGVGTGGTGPKKAAVPKDPTKAKAKASVALTNDVGAWSPCLMSFVDNALSLHIPM